MAKTIIEMFEENFKKHGDLEKALYSTISVSNYPRYRERVIENFPKFREEFTINEKSFFIVRKE